MNRAWLRMRRDALVDRVLGYALVPLLVVLVPLVGALPGELVAGAAGIAVGLALANIKKIPDIAETRFSNEPYFQ